MLIVFFFGNCYSYANHICIAIYNENGNGSSSVTTSLLQLAIVVFVCTKLKMTHINVRFVEQRTSQNTTVVQF